MSGYNIIVKKRGKNLRIRYFLRVLYCLSYGISAQPDSNTQFTISPLTSPVRRRAASKAVTARAGDLIKYVQNEREN